jgi:hypothetical protein
MIRFELKLLPETSGDAQAVSHANALAENSLKHLKSLIANKKCKKHPSYANKITVVAGFGENPNVEVNDACCKEFYKLLQ